MITAWILDAVRSTLYMAIHDILPTRERLNKIALFANDRFTYCGQTDTLSHRIIKCGAGRFMWRWNRVRIAAILRSNANHISDDWPLRPQFNLWPRQRHWAVLWILAFSSNFMCSTPISLPCWTMWTSCGGRAGRCTPYCSVSRGSGTICQCCRSLAFFPPIVPRYPREDCGWMPRQSENLFSHDGL